MSLTLFPQADFVLGCSVQLLRVHVKNSNVQCVGSNACALKRFDLKSLQGSDWTLLGRHEMVQQSGVSEKLGGVGLVDNRPSTD